MVLHTITRTALDTHGCKWCVQGTNLILILANYRLGVSMPKIHDLLWKEPLRSHVSDTYEFVVGEYQALTSDAALGGYRQTS